MLLLKSFITSFLAMTWSFHSNAWRLFFFSKWHFLKLSRFLLEHDCDLYILHFLFHCVLSRNFMSRKKIPYNEILCISQEFFVGAFELLEARQQDGDREDVGNFFSFFFSFIGPCFKPLDFLLTWTHTFGLAPAGQWWKWFPAWSWSSYGFLSSEWVLQSSMFPSRPLLIHLSMTSLW